AALAALEREPAGGAGSDAELERIQARARLTASRTLTRDAASSIDPTARPPAPVLVALSCRAGLERLLADEATAAGFTALSVATGRVEVTLVGPLESLLALRLHTAIAFPLAPRSGAAAAAVVEAVTSPEAAALFDAFTRGSMRYRVAWAGGGHRRSEVWRIAREVAARRPELVNDPTRSTWQVEVDVAGSAVRVALEPRALEDPRFAYRVRDVPAASHPTIAAALARLAVQHSARPADDVVWDPFVGSALELIERARLAPVRQLAGTDREAAALDAARANLAAAGVAAELTLGDALDAAPPSQPTVILTNPPMGRRVQRGRAEDLLLRLVDRAGALLAPGGLLCWISPWPGKTRERAARAGLTLVDARVVDMGGFAAEIQVFQRR
ncbi:MAG TPA: methyltransferase, partial [Kofleriaceae bacterium]|nr:methyltransferase [Kofleriaceae bacterium]